MYINTQYILTFNILTINNIKDNIEVKINIYVLNAVLPRQQVDGGWR